MLPSMARLAFKLSVLSILLLGLPLLGVWLMGRPVQPYLRMPPATGLVSHAGFSSLAFALLSAVAAVALLVPVVLLGKGLGRRSREPQPPRRFPLWGWLGLGLTLISWTVAWGDFPALRAIRPFMFPPLWLGYVISVNAATHALGGKAPWYNDPAVSWPCFP